MSDIEISDDLKKLAPGRVNKEQAFLTYASFAGDVEKTAFALNLRPQDVIDAAETFKWNTKLRAILELKKSASPGDLERAINRSISFVQAHRARLFIDRVLTKLESFDEEQLEEYIFPNEAIVSKKGDSLGTVRKVSTRPLADLASSIEKLASVCAQALQDTSQDRAKRAEASGGGEASGGIHAAIAKAMSELGAEKTTEGLLLEAQIAVGTAQAAKVKTV